MNINFNEMNEEAKEIYKFMWGREDNIPGGSCNLCRTYNKRYSKESKNSYSFFTGLDNKDIVVKNKKINEENKRKVCEYLLKIFKIDNKEIFCKKFNEVCSGSGGEAAKITTLHSSSLCGLLFFYNVNQRNITFTLNGKKITFDDVYFEFKNKVTDNGNPSNIDIVLISNKQKAILFLESKFSEYLTPGSEEVRFAYKEEFGHDIYNEVFLNKIGMQFKKSKDGNIKREKKNKKTGKKTEYFVIESIPSKPSVYAAGIKQFISHFIGVRNYIENGPDYREKRSLPTNYEVYLGEIVFDGFSFERGESQYKNYKNYYNLLVNGLNTLNPKFEILEDLLVYSKLIKHCEPIVRNYYFRNSRKNE